MFPPGTAQEHSSRTCSDQHPLRPAGAVGLFRGGPVRRHASADLSGAVFAGAQSGDGAEGALSLHRNTVVRPVGAVSAEREGFDRPVGALPLDRRSAGSPVCPVSVGGKGSDSPVGRVLAGKIGTNSPVWGLRLDGIGTDSGCVLS